MSGLLIVLLLALTFGISWWNAYVAGVNWIEARIAGGFARLLVWSAAIQSACGFTVCLAAAAAFLAWGTGYVPPQALKLLMELTYLLLILPVIGSGLVITAHGWMAFARERSVLNAGVAAWNTYAMASDLVDAIRVLPGVMGNVGEAFGKAFSGDGDEDELVGKLGAGVVVVVCLIAACCILGGVLLTAEIVKRHAGTRPVALPERARA